MSGASNEKGMVRGFFTGLGEFSSRLVRRHLSDAFIFAPLLTVLTMLIAGYCENLPLKYRGSNAKTSTEQTHLRQYLPKFARCEERPEL